MSEYFKIRLFVGAIILLIVCFVTSCNELRYQMFGKATTAEILKLTVVTEGRRSKSLAIDYQFKDVDGTLRKEEDRVSTSWTPPEPSEPNARPVVDIVFIPGSPDSSRLAGQTNWPALLVTAGVLGLVVFPGVRFWIGYREHEKRMAMER